MSYVQLHTFSEYSIGDGICNINDYISKAKDFGCEHLGLKFKGSLLGSLEFHYKCKHANLNPIICMDLNVHRGVEDVIDYPITLYAKNHEGYNNLLFLSKAVLDRKGLSKELLGSHKDGLIASSAGIYGEIAYSLLNHSPEKGIKAAEEYIELFEEFYIELIPGFNGESLRLNKKLNEIANRLKIRTLANSTVNFLDKTHLVPFLVSRHLHDRLSCHLKEKDRRNYENCYFHTVIEINYLFPGGEKAIENSELLAKSCCLVLPKLTPQLPEFKLPVGFLNADEYLRHLVEINLIKISLGDDSNRQKIQDQLERELIYVAKNKQSNYFLIISDLIQWARINNIFIQNGRGVSSGSMLYFILGITQINPITFNLSFEGTISFISETVYPVSLCVDEEGWEPLINYLKDKFGSEHISNIVSFRKRLDIIFMEDLAKTHGFSIQDLGFTDFLKTHEDLWSYISDSSSESTFFGIKKKIQQTSFNKSHKFFSETSMDKPFYQNWVNHYIYKTGCQFIDEFRQYTSKNNINVDESYWKQFFKTLYVLHRTVYSYKISQHKIGISKEKSHLVQPAIKNPNGQYLIENPVYSNRSIHTVDILKDNGMSILKKCQNLIQKKDEVFNIQNIPVDDPKCYVYLNTLLFTDNSFNIPNFERGYQKIVRQVKPNCFEELIACNGLFYPSQNEVVELYVKVKQSPGSAVYEHPAFEDVLKNTYGIFLYQEQLMTLIHKISKLTMAKTIRARNIINRKREDELSKFKDEFIFKASSNGFSRAEASQIFKIFCIQSPKLINKAFLTSQAFFSYQFLYCMTHYNEEFQEAQKLSNKWIST
ncbi:MAG: PHP domain-containing protein [Spirochaetales bacterium]|nr:PHP domain-containing protein [Spirochaetales bacterium]